MKINGYFFLALPLLFAFNCYAALPDAKVVAPMEFAKEYIREIGELNRLTDEARNDTTNKSPEVFTNFIYHSERIQHVLGTDINLLASMKLNGQLTDLPSILSQSYIRKGETMSSLSAISEDMISMSAQDPNSLKQVQDNLKLMPKLRAQNDQVDEDIAKKVNILVFLSLVDPNGDGKGGTSKLVITRKDRIELIEQLKTEFGKKLEDKKDPHWYLFAGQMFYEALNTHLGFDEISAAPKK